MNRRGFTVVELLVVIAIIGMLLVLGVVNLSGSQVKGRDVERKTDIENIGLNLEAFYKTGADDSTAFGRYPSTAMFDSSSDTFKSFLENIDLESLIAPGATDSVTSFLDASNNTQTTAGVSPQPTSSTYVYQPLQGDGSLCTAETQDCRKFNLYYLLEYDSTIDTVTSKNQ